MLFILICVVMYCTGRMSKNGFINHLLGYAIFFVSMLIIVNGLVFASFKKAVEKINYQQPTYDYTYDKGLY